MYLLVTKMLKIFRSHYIMEHKIVQWLYILLCYQIR